MAYKTVTIGCKLPNGILLQVGQEVLNINGMDHSGNDEFAMTANVPEHFWLAWLNSNKDLDIVKNGRYLLMQIVNILRLSPRIEGQKKSVMSLLQMLNR